MLAFFFWASTPDAKEHLGCGDPPLNWQGGWTGLGAGWNGADLGRRQGIAEADYSSTSNLHQDAIPSGAILYAHLFLLRLAPATGHIQGGLLSINGLWRVRENIFFLFLKLPNHRYSMQHCLFWHNGILW